MPGMSGLDMIPHVKELSPDTVVVMISGMQTVESAIGALRLGAFDYLMKPFDLRQVEAVVKRALEHHDLVVAKQRYENHLEELVEQRTAELDRALNSLEGAYRSTLKALTAALETRDSETHGHSERVVTYSLRLGREYGLNSEEMKALEFGSLLARHRQDRRAGFDPAQAGEAHGRRMGAHARTSAARAADSARH